MQIGLISTPWVPVPPEGYGGLEYILDRLARGLLHAGHDVLLAAPANSDCPVPKVEGLDVVDHAAAISGDTVTEMAHIARAYDAMGEMDLIHDHTIGGPLYPEPDSRARLTFGGGRPGRRSGTGSCSTRSPAR